jgi:NDP-sugar pyrophosphorylase family protein
VLAINLIELDRRGLPRLIGDRVTLPAGTTVERSVIGEGVLVRHPIRIVNSVILPNAVVDSKHDLDGVVLDGEHTIYCPALGTHAQ